MRQFKIFVKCRSEPDDYKLLGRSKMHAKRLTFRLFYGYSRSYELCSKVRVKRRRFQRHVRRNKFNCSEFDVPVILGGRQYFIYKTKAVFWRLRSRLVKRDRIQKAAERKFRQEHRCNVRILKR